MTVSSGSILFAGGEMSSLDDYIAAGGGRALASALESSAQAVIDEVKRSGLRGRGGGGSPPEPNGRPSGPTRAPPSS